MLFTYCSVAQCFVFFILFQPLSVLIIVLCYGGLFDGGFSGDSFFSRVKGSGEILSFCPLPYWMFLLVECF